MSKTKKASKNPVSPPSWFTGYKSNNAHYGNSSFWLDNDFIESAQVKNGVDVVKLAGYKRAISNFVRIVTNRDNIDVQFSSGKDSYTDGRQVVISSKLDDKEFDSTVGLALHEGSHILLTDFLALTKYFSSKKWTEQYNNTDYSKVKEYEANLKTLVNIIEDRRIDRYVYTSAPGYQGYYKALYNRYFNSAEIDRALISNVKTSVTWDSYLFHICNFTNPNRNLMALPGLMDIWNVINLPRISRLMSTSDTIEVAQQVFDIIKSYVVDDAAATPESNSNNNTQNSNPGNSGDSNSEYEVDDSADSDDSGSNGMDPNLDASGGSSESSDSENSQEQSNGDGDSGDVEPGDDNSTQMSDKERRALEKAIQKQQDFLNGKIQKKSLSRKDAKQVQAIANSDATAVSVGGTFTDADGNIQKGTTASCVVINGCSKELVDSGLLNHHWNVGKPSRRSIEVVNEGITLGTLLGKKLKTRDEERSLQTSRLETGVIDRRLIAELGFGNVNVFKQVLHNTVTPALIHITLDASGSMHYSKWNSAIKTAVAIAKACTMTSSIQCVISLRGETSSGDRRPLMWVFYDSRKDSFRGSIERFMRVEAGGRTPEGLCFEAIHKDIIKTANGRDSYLINICDGEPGFQNGEIRYYGEYAEQHSRLQVDKIRRGGVKVLSYFAYDYFSDNSWNVFKSIYGADALKINLDNLAELSKSINSKFIRN